MLRHLRRLNGFDRRLVCALLGLTLTVHGAATLARGEATYVTHYAMLASPHVAVVLGVALLLLSVVPYRRLLRLGASPVAKIGLVPEVLSGADEALPPPPGRNEPCPCGSGTKYKRCCRRRREVEARRDALARRTAALNRAHGVRGATDMANRGLHGR